jgi:hypothetical protein
VQKKTATLKRVRKIINETNPNSSEFLVWSSSIIHSGDSEDGKRRVATFKNIWRQRAEILRDTIAKDFSIPAGKEIFAINEPQQIWISLAPADRSRLSEEAQKLFTEFLEFLKEYDFPIPK